MLRPWRQVDRVVPFTPERRRMCSFVWVPAGTTHCGIHCSFHNSNLHLCPGCEQTV